MNWNIKTWLFASILACSPSIIFAQKNAKSTVIDDIITIDLPAYNLKNIDNTLLTKADLNSEWPTMIVMFNPTCDHCEDFGKDLVKHSAQFQQINIVFVAAPPLHDYLADFASQIAYNQWKGTNLKLTVDTDGSLLQQLFDYVTLPEIKIYDKKGAFLYSKNALDNISNISDWMSTHLK